LVEVVNVVGSPRPQAVTSELPGSTMKVDEIRVESANAAGVRDGGPGGDDPTMGVPQLKRPPLPVTLTAPSGHTGTGDAAPESAQSKVAPDAGFSRMLPSMASQFDGRAWEKMGCTSGATAARARTRTAADRRRTGRTVGGSVHDFTHGFNSVMAQDLRGAWQLAAGGGRPPDVPRQASAGRLIR